MPKISTAQKSPWIFALLLFLGALSFTCALAWNDLAKHATERMTQSDNSTKGKVIYAAIVTVALIGIAYVVAKAFPEVIQG